MHKFFEATHDPILSSFKVKKQLNPQLWEDEKLKPEVRDALLKIAKKYLEFAKVGESKVFDIQLTGSNANYDWSKFSDIDLHMIIDYDQLDPSHNMAVEYLKDKKTIWAFKHHIKIHGYDIEPYIQNIHDHLVSGGVYSLTKNKWISQPKKLTFKLAEQQISTKAHDIMNQIDLAINEHNLAALGMIEEKIRKMRVSGLEEAGEFSIENMAFKYLRRNGYIDKLKREKESIEDHYYSLK